MYDAVDLGGVPADATMVAGYIDGYWQTYPQIPSRFPAAEAVSITVWDGDALVLDIETGDARPDMAGGWVARQQAAGKRTVLYCNSSTWPAVQHDCEMHNVRPDGYWIAQYDNDPTIPANWAAAGCVAKQYQSTDAYDISTVLDTWPSTFVPPVAPTAATVPPFFSGDPMDPALFIRWCYATVLLREPDSPEKQAEWEAKFKTDGPDLTYAAFLDSAEGQARQAQRRRILDEAQSRMDAEKAALPHP